MLQNVADGFLGLFMFFAHWLSPGDDQGEIKVAAVRELHGRAVLECVIAFDWNNRMSDLVDAGIPMRLRIFSCSNLGDTIISIRSFICDVSAYDYYICDSLVAPPSDGVYLSKRHRQLYGALREFQRVSRSFDTASSSIHFEAVLLPSRVSQMNRSIDISDICGFRKLSTKIIRKETKR